MTPQVMEYVAKHGPEGKVLEVGSYNVNGSMRNFYPDYIGVDLREGNGVDMVYKDRLPFDDSTFDKVIYLEVMEHDLFFWRTFDEMRRVLKTGGKLIVTTRGFAFPKHDFPHDYYRFTAQAIQGILADAGFVNGSVTDQTGDDGVFGFGTKA